MQRFYPEHLISYLSKIDNYSRGSFIFPDIDLAGIQVWESKNELNNERQYKND
jgi:hypothetical protein